VVLPAPRKPESTVTGSLFMATPLLAVVRYAAVAALLAINVISLHSFG